MSELLRIEDLHVSFKTDDGMVRAVDGVSLTLSAGETVAIVGESGSGKTVTSLSVMGLHKKGQAEISGSISLSDHGTFKDVVHLSDDEIRDIRGRAVAMIFQDPMSSLHPYYKIGNQLAEAYLVHNRGKKKEAMARALEMLDLVGIPEPAKRAQEFPHQFSGGMRQRVMIAMALMNSPQILIADEPTTALDVTVQDQILRLIDEMVSRRGLAILLITHNLGNVRRLTDRTYIMYAGQIVEMAPTRELFNQPMHPYTKGLISSVPKLTGEGIASGIKGMIPDYRHPPEGCRFHPRCEHAMPICRSKPPSFNAGSGHKVACFLFHKTAIVRNIGGR